MKTYTFTTKQVAEILQLTVQTVRRLAKTGKIRGTRISGRQWRFTQDNINEFLNSPNQGQPNE